MLRTCSICHEQKPANDENFYWKRRKGRADTLTSACRPCWRAYIAKRYQPTPEQASRNKARYQQKLRPERVAKTRLEQRDRYLRGRHKITLSDYGQLHTSQQGLCAICGRPPAGRFKHLSVDHDHRTGAIRGLLCNPCNRALGLLGDDAHVLARAAAYLRAKRPAR